MKVDYSEDVKLAKSKTLRIIFIILGTISFILGVIGIFTPVLPTTPFLLLASYFYAKSSKRFYNWLLNSKFFGEIILTWRNSRRISLNTKIFAITTIVVTISSSIYFFIPNLTWKIVVGSVGLIIIYFISRIPLRR